MLTTFSAYRRLRSGLSRLGRMVVVVGAAGVASACTGPQADKPDEAAAYVLGGQYLRDWQSALRPDTAVAEIAQAANRLSVARSPTAFELAAAQAEAKAERAEWFPRLRPVGAIGMASGSAAVGVSVTQMIYDFSQSRTRRERADIARAVKGIEFWAERNEDVHSALTAFVDAVEAEEILTLRAELETRLAVLALREDDRLASGVAGQGDTLFVAVSRQENRRAMIRQEARKSDALSRLQRHTDLQTDAVGRLRLGALDRSCALPPSVDHAPDLMRARMLVELAEMAAKEARNNLFPRIVAAGDVTTAGGGTLQDTARVSLEAGSLAGGGGRNRVLAADLTVQAAQRGLENTRAELMRERDRLGIETRATEATLKDYGDMVETTEQSLALFQDRFLAGAATSAEAVRLEIERTENLVAIVESRTALERTCLDGARGFGALTPADNAAR